MRDLASYFWPHHQWIRRTVMSGALPLWAPEVGLGYATIADPNLQLFFPTLPLRLLLPDALGFNLMVALPVPIAAWGAFLFLRRRFSAPAAALGALVYAISGPFLSTLTFPNLSTSAALIPWVLWAVDRVVERPSLRRGACLAVAMALELLGGEPLTLLGTGIVSVTYAALAARDLGRRGAALARVVVVIAVSQAVGTLLAAAQILPLVDAATRSPRAVRAAAAGLIGDGWSLHPLALIEAVAPAVLGGPTDSIRTWSPWLFPLNGGREPFLGSIYVGAATLAVAALAAFARERRWWARFWFVVLAAAVVLALGYFTPVYPWLRATVPGFASLRFPAKFALFATLALGCLTAAGWEQLAAHRARRAVGIIVAAVIAGGALLALLVALGAPALVASALAKLAAGVGVAAPAAAADYLATSLTMTAPRVVAIGAAAVLCLWLVGAGRPMARWILLGTIVLDLLAATMPLNPTIDTWWVAEPTWVKAVRARADERFYAGDLGILPKGDPDLPTTIDVLPDTPAPAATALYTTTLGTYPLGWGLRSALAPDLTRLRPVAYTVLLERFAASDRDARYRFLHRAGVRYLLAPSPPPGAGAPLTKVERMAPMAVYADLEHGPRALVVPLARVVPDATVRLGAMFAPEFAMEREVLLAAPPGPPAGAPSPGATQRTARIVGEQPTTIRVDAIVPDGGGYVVLLDAYDPNWTVDVDGTRAPLLEANGLFRAVAVAAGKHDVVFRYRSRPLAIGVAISIVAGILLFAACLAPRAGRPLA